MTLWLPLLNHGMGQEPISRRIASLVPRDSCVLVHGLSHAQIAGLRYHGDLKLQITREGKRSACRALVVDPRSYTTLEKSIDLSQWRLLTQVPRLRENRDHLLLFLRRD